MPHLTVTRTIAAPVETVFAYVDDYKNTTNYMKDLVRWEPAGKIVHGVGAEFAVGMKAGPKVLEAVVQFSEWKENATMAWHSISGMSQTGRWSFKKMGNVTEATFDMEFDFGGGFAGKLVAKAAEPVVRANVEHSVDALRILVEKLSVKAKVGTATKTATKKKTSV